MMLTDPNYAALLDNSFALSAWVGSVCVGAAGVAFIHRGRALAWALLSPMSGKYMRQITRKVRQGLDTHPCKRIEMTVSCDFKQGHQWAKLLGFKCEAPCMEKSGVMGNDEALYARIK